MTEGNGTGREGTSGWWGPALRALRLRSNMKQDDAASRLKVSQSYISRLENGVIEPSPDIVLRLRELLHNPVHRPLVDQLRAIVRHSPHAVALLTNEGERVRVIEASLRFRQAGPPYDSLTPGIEVTDPLGRLVAGFVRQLIGYGAFNGEIACAELVWHAPVEGEMRWFHSVQTPVFTGSEWLVHTATASMSEGAFEHFINRNGGPEKVHHF